MTSTTHFKPMTNTNNTKTNTSAVDRSLIRRIATAVAPLAVVMGIAAMSIPSAEAYRYTTSCYNYGCDTTRSW